MDATTEQEQVEQTAPLDVPTMPIRVNLSLDYYERLQQIQNKLHRMYPLMPRPSVVQVIEFMLDLVVSIEVPQ